MIFDLIIGIHSIELALDKRTYSEAVLYVTKETYDANLSRFKSSARLEIVFLGNEELQREAQRQFTKEGFEYQRIPNGAFLVIEAKPIRDLAWVYQQLEKKPLRLLAIDNVTDVHNRAAIFRTAAFFGVDAILLSQKNLDTFPPSFYRISSGGAELVEIVNCSALSRAIESLNDKGVVSLGFDEKGEEFDSALISKSSTILVLGSEDLGLSNSVKRTLKKIVSLDGPGELKTLNVSVSAAVAMQKMWGV